MNTNDFPIIWQFKSQAPMSIDHQKSNSDIPIKDGMQFRGMNKRHSKRSSKRLNKNEFKLNKRIQTDFFPYEMQHVYENLLIPKIEGLSQFSRIKH